MPNSHKAKVGEQVYRTLPSMNLCPSSSSGSLNTGQASQTWTVPPLLILSQRLSTASTPTTRRPPAWSLPPHSLAQNLFAFLFTIFYRPDRLIEGFGAGSVFSGSSRCPLSCPTETISPGLPRLAPHLSRRFGNAPSHLPTSSGPLGQSTMPKSLSLRTSSSLAQTKNPDPQSYVSKWNKDNRPEFKTAMLLVQTCTDRVSPWTLSPLLLSYLYNLGIKVLTLHDDLEAQKDYALLHQKPLVHSPISALIVNDYERVVPTLKTFSASTFFSNFLEPLTYEQLEAREGSLGSTYLPQIFLIS